jgi:signal peptidase I
MVKGIFSFVLEVVKISLIALAIVIPIRYFLFQPFFVRGESMDPNFANGDYLIVDEITYHFKNPERGEVIVFNAPYDLTQRLIKRVIGLPGETIEVKNGKIVIYDNSGSKVLDESKYLFGVETGGDVKITLKEDEFFVLGDNRPFSYDSRRFGPVKKENIIGRVLLRAWPFASVNRFKVPTY